QATATSLLAPPVADARTAALDEISGLATSLADAQVVFERMPWFLGADGPRRYLFGAQNPAELRGTGGLLGVYAILTIEDGDFVFSRFRPDGTAPNVPTRQVDAPADYERLYTQFGGAGFWLNANMSPDLPSTAVALENLWRASGRGQLDGVILADPFAFRAMLEATGPVRPPSLDVELTSTNVVDYVTNGVYTDMPVPDERKEALGEAVHAVVDAFMTSSSSPQASLDAMAEILGSGHAQVYVDDRELQGVLAGGVVGGALASDDADLLGVVINSAGGNKVDFYLDRAIEHTVRLGDDGSASASTEIELHNDAPLQGAPQYVLGPFAGVSRRGENVMLLQTYCSERCAFTDKRSEGNVEDHGTAVEQGLPLTWDYVRIPSGETATVRYATALDEAWTGDRFGGTYRFRYVGPPTIRPTQMRLSVTVPAGMEITSTSVPMEIVGSTATWTGDPDRLLDIEVGFRPPPLRRAWLFAWHVVTQPLVRL
ncbi:MAG TPA: DUF4012 domain-containing protein, partial [Actinomycetota bacterium]|nr:DUF4012 domain-containing protein [Actinomycetota bacterium]